MLLVPSISTFETTVHCCAVCFRFFLFARFVFDFQAVRLAISLTVELLFCDGLYVGNFRSISTVAAAPILMSAVVVDFGCLVTDQVENKVLEMAQHASFHQHVSYNLSTILHALTAGTTIPLLFHSLPHAAVSVEVNRSRWRFLLGVYLASRTCRPVVRYVPILAHVLFVGKP